MTTENALSSYGRAFGDLSGAKYTDRIDLPDGTILWCDSELTDHLRLRVQDAVASPIYPGDGAASICAYLQMYRYRFRWLPQSGDLQQYIVTRD